MDQRHFWTALRYVEQNPARERLVRLQWRYAWSSAAPHVGGRDAAHLLDMAWFEERIAFPDWENALRTRLDEEELAALRSRWERGWLLASDK